MNKKGILMRGAGMLALASLAMAPMTALARDDDDGRKRSKHSRSRGHDCEDDRYYSNRRHDNGRRAWQERQRVEEQRRREAQWRYEQDRRRYDDRYRDDYGYRDDGRYRDEYRHSPGYEYQRREQTKNEWRNLALGAGLVAAIGLLNDDPTLTFAGAAGALYSVYRYEQDRKSQNSLRRLRATYFSQPYYYRDGERYTRRTVERNGQSYYQFCRG